MIRFLKINFVYFLSRKNICSLFICIMIMLLIDLYVIISNQTLSLNAIEIQNYSWETLYSFNKIITVILGCFLFNNFILSINDNYKVLFIINSDNVKFYYLSKVITVLIVLFIFVFFSFAIYTIINISCNTRFVMTIQCVKGYLFVFLLSVVYGLISLICTKILDNTYSIMIPIVIYICCEFFEFNDSIVNTFFPNFTLTMLENDFFLSLIHCIIVSFFYLVTFCLIQNE